MYVEAVKDILLFRGFSRRSFRGKLKWLFLLYPIGLAGLLFGLCYLLGLVPILLSSWLSSKKRK